jgi:flagellar basal body-associated protein FliL
MGSELLLRVIVMFLGVTIILIALLGLTDTNPFVAIVALIIGAMLAVLGLFFPRVKSLGGSGSTPTTTTKDKRQPNPTQDVAAQVINDPRFLRLVVRQLQVRNTDIMQAVADQSSEVKAQIFDALNEERRKSSR